MRIVQEAIEVFDIGLQFSDFLVTRLQLSSNREIAAGHLLQLCTDLCQVALSGFMRPAFRGQRLLGGFAFQRQLAHLAFEFGDTGIEPVSLGLDLFQFQFGKFGLLLQPHEGGVDTAVLFELGELIGQFFNHAVEPGIFVVQLLVLYRLSGEFRCLLTGSCGFGGSLGVGLLHSAQFCFEFFCAFFAFCQLAVQAGDSLAQVGRFRFLLGAFNEPL